MVIFADIVLNPGGIVAWLAVGLIAGWLAGKVLDRRGFGVVTDVVLGLVGALVGGFLYGLMTGNQTATWETSGFWSSVGIAFIGACALLLGARFLGYGRRA
jgi:uncharacterized membrane protein YeaQ/YmgE (transglycosylase-associated protein family)